jgi:DNA-binding transcriptional regulator YdaS (Cro superfamily)
VSTALKNTRLNQVKPGRRAKLADGKVVVVSALVSGDVFCREVLEEDYQWLPGRFGDRTGELHVQLGDQLVQEVW